MTHSVIKEAISSKRVTDEFYHNVLSRLDDETAADAPSKPKQPAFFTKDVYVPF